MHFAHTQMKRARPRWVSNEFTATCDKLGNWSNDQEPSNFFILDGGHEYVRCEAAHVDQLSRAWSVCIQQRRTQPVHLLQLRPPRWCLELHISCRSGDAAALVDRVHSILESMHPDPGSSTIFQHAGRLTMFWPDLLVDKQILHQVRHMVLGCLCADNTADQCTLASPASADLQPLAFSKRDGWWPCPGSQLMLVCPGCHKSRNRSCITCYGQGLVSEPADAVQVWQRDTSGNLQELRDVEQLQDALKRCCFRLDPVTGTVDERWQRALLRPYAPITCALPCTDFSHLKGSHALLSVDAATIKALTSLFKRINLVFANLQIAAVSQRSKDTWLVLVWGTNSSYCCNNAGIHDIQTVSSNPTTHFRIKKERKVYTVCQVCTECPITNNHTKPITLAQDEQPVLVDAFRRAALATTSQ